MKITLGTTYFENPDNLFEFVKFHQPFVEELIIVDDGSTKYPISRYISYLSKFNNLIVYQLKRDYGFNSHGCRNLIANKSSNDWIIFLDIDRVMLDPELFISCLKNKKLQKNCRYRFLSFLGEPGNKIHGSVNDFFIYKNHFFSVGGYDEELQGIRNGDRFFFEQLKLNGTERLLKKCTIILTRPSSLSSKEIIKSNNDKFQGYNKIMNKIAHRAMNPEPNKPILQFDYTRLI